jgi:uncharacterized membrane protein
VVVNTTRHASPRCRQVPREFDMDHQHALALARANGGFVTQRQLRETQGWPPQRVERAVNQLIQSGMVRGVRVM